MNSKCIRILKANWKTLIQARRAYFAFSTNGYDARRNAHAVPILLVDKVPMSKTTITTQQPGAKVDKVAFGEVVVNKAGSFVFNVDPKSTLTATTTVRDVMKHFASLATASGALKELSSLQNFSKMARPKVETASASIKLDLTSDDELATKGGKKSYLKNKQKQEQDKSGTRKKGLGHSAPLSDDEVAAESTFSALLVGLKKWNATFHGQITRENIGYAKGELVEVGKVAARWKTDHSKKADSKRGKAVESVIQKLASLNAQIKEHEAVWWSEDETNEMMDMADKLIDNGLGDPDYKGNLRFMLADADKVIKFLVARIKAPRIQQDDRSTLNLRLDQVRAARTRALKDQRARLDQQIQKLDKAWDQLGKMDNPKAREQIVRLTTESLGDIKTQSEDISSYLNDDTPMGPTALVAMREAAEKLVEEVTSLMLQARKVDPDNTRLDSDIQKTMGAINALMNGLRRRGCDSNELGPITRSLTSASLQLTQLLIERAQASGGDWAGSLGRENTCASTMRANLVRFEGRDFANELFADAAELIAQDRDLVARDVDFEPVEWLEQRSQLKALAKKRLAGMGLADNIIEDAVAMVWPAVSVSRVYDPSVVPTPGLVATAVLRKHPDLLVAYCRQLDTVVNSKLAHSSGVIDFQAILTARIEEGLPIAPVDIIRALSTELRGSDETLEERLEAMQLVDKGDKDLEARASEAMAMTVAIQQKSQRSNKELYEKVTAIFKAAVDPLLKPGVAARIPKNIRVICLSAVSESGKRGATERQKFNLVRDILVLRWLAPTITNHGGQIDDEAKPSRQPMGKLMQYSANGTTSSEANIAPLMPLVTEYTPKFQSFFEDIIVATIKELKESGKQARVA